MRNQFLMALLCTLGAATWLAIWPTLVMPAELRTRDIVATVAIVAAVGGLQIWIMGRRSDDTKRKDR